MSKLSVEQLVGTIRALTPEERERFEQLLERPATNAVNGEHAPAQSNGDNRAMPPPSNKIPPIEMRRIPPLRSHPKGIKEEQAWLNQHGSQYAGQWVALDGNRLIRAGATIKEVHEAAIAAGIDDALIVLVESPNALPFAGF